MTVGAAGQIILDKMPRRFLSSSFLNTDSHDMTCAIWHDTIGSGLERERLIAVQHKKVKDLCGSILG